MKYQQLICYFHSPPEGVVYIRESLNTFAKYSLLKRSYITLATYLIYDSKKKLYDNEV